MRCGGKEVVLILFCVLVFLLGGALCFGVLKG